MIQKKQLKTVKNQLGDVINGVEYPSYCTIYYCYTHQKLSKLQKIHEQIDLRQEGLTSGIQDQGDFGSCYAFGAAAILENSLLIDQNSYNDANNQTLQYWHTNAQNVTLSQQFIISNAIYENYDQGGDGTSAINFIGTYMQTFEYNKNFEYDPNRYRQYYNNNTLLLPTNQTQQNKLLPYKLYNAASSDMSYTNKTRFQLPINAIFLNYNSRFDDTTIQNVMSVLSRGIAVLASMNTKVSTKAATRLSSYTNGVLDYPCDGQANKMDHQVTFIGYGSYNGEKVWIIKNSWGKWGDQGSFYVPIGKDSYCLEHYAFYIVPKFYDTSSGTFQKNQFTKANDYSKQSQLDADNYQLIDNTQQALDIDYDDVNVGLIVAIVLIVVVFLIIVTVIAVYYCKKQKQQQQQNMNVIQFDYGTNYHNL